MLNNERGLFLTRKLARTLKLLLSGTVLQVAFSELNLNDKILLPSSNSTPNSISTSTQLDLHFKSIQLLQELSWSYALFLVCTYRLLLPAYRLQLPPTILLF